MDWDHLARVLSATQYDSNSKAVGIDVILTLMPLNLSEAGDCPKHVPMSACTKVQDLM